MHSPPSLTYSMYYLTYLTASLLDPLVHAPRIWQPASLKCGKRRAIAEELLMLNPDALEFNSRKLRALCKCELEFIAKEGRLPLKATPQGSMVFAIVSAISVTLLSDTQLAESINSIIKLISTRCPRIDLETLSARIVIKKSTCFSRDVHCYHDEDRAVKRWSNLKRQLHPILDECIGVGDNFNAILNERGRFTPPGLIDHSEPHARLNNKNVALALPSGNDSSDRWVACSLVAVNRCEKPGVEALYNDCSLLCLRVTSNLNPDANFIVLETGRQRSERFVTKLCLDGEGNIILPMAANKLKLEIVSLSNLLGECFGLCCADVTIDACPVLWGTDGGLVASPLDPLVAGLIGAEDANSLVVLNPTALPFARGTSFNSLIHIDKDIHLTVKGKVSKRDGPEAIESEPKEDDDDDEEEAGGDSSVAAQELVDLKAGYGYDSDEDTDQTAMTQMLESELGERDLNACKRTAKTIKDTGVFQTSLKVPCLQYC